MFEEHISNLKERIANYELSSAEDAPVNVPVKISSRQASIIDLIRIDSSVTTDDLARKIHVSSKTVKRDIAYLKQQGILLREGSDKKGS